MSLDASLPISCGRHVIDGDGCRLNLLFDGLDIVMQARASQMASGHHRPLPQCAQLLPSPPHRS